MLDNLEHKPQQSPAPQKASAKFWSCIAKSTVNAAPDPAASELLRRKRELIGKTVKGHLKIKGPASGRIYWLRWNSTKCDLVSVPLSAVMAFFEGQNPRNNARVQCVIKGINKPNEKGLAHPYCTAIAAAKRTRTRKRKGANSSYPPSLTASPSITPAMTPEPRAIPMVSARFANAFSSVMRPYSPRTARRITIGPPSKSASPPPVSHIPRPRVTRRRGRSKSLVISKPAGRMQPRAPAVDLRAPMPVAGLLKTRPTPMVFSEMLQRRKSGGFWNNFMFGNHQVGKQTARDSAPASPKTVESSTTETTETTELVTMFTI